MNLSKIEKECYPSVEKLYDERYPKEKTIQEIKAFYEDREMREYFEKQTIK